jgi:flagellar L-ring protein precursor FlgH
MHKFSLAVAAMIMILLAGCSITTPSSSIKQPMTARSAGKATVSQDNGAIFQAGQNEHPLFEDIRARNVGDILTINLVENTSAAQKNGSSASHTGSANSSISGLNNGLPLIGASSGNKFANSVANSGSNLLTGTISVTVIEVLPNGNLQVAGEKQVAINQVKEYVRLSGVVDPRTIGAGNTVQSTQVADARIEYKGADSNVDTASVLSMLSRFFQSLLPF